MARRDVPEGRELLLGSRALRRVLALALVATLVALPLGRAQAGDDADPDSYRSLDVGSGVVTLDVQDAPFGQVVDELIQPRTRVNLIVAP